MGFGNNPSYIYQEVGAHHSLFTKAQCIYPAFFLTVEKRKEKEGGGGGGEGEGDGREGGRREGQGKKPT